MRKYIVIALLLVLKLSNQVFAQCPEITNSTINGATTIITACPGDTITLNTTGNNLPVGGTIDWYQSPFSNFNPYNQQGTFLGSSVLPGGNGANCPDVCPDLLALFINACNGRGVEWDNEYIIFSAGKGFKVDDLEVDLPNNINVPNSTTNNDINMGIAPCGLQIPQSKLIDSLRKGSCNPSNILPANPGSTIPAGALVFLFTGNDVTVTYDLGDLCASGKVIYVLQSDCNRTAGAFVNSPSCTGNNQERTTKIQLKNCNCVDSMVYSRCGLVDLDGEYAFDNGEDIQTTDNGGVTIGANPCNGPNFDQLPIPVLPLELKFVASDSLCNGGTRFIKAIVNPTPSGQCQQVFSQTLEFRVVCPDVTFAPSAPQICTGGTTNIQLSSSAPNATFSWTVNEQNNVTGATSGSGNNISQTLNLVQSGNGTVKYDVTATANGCKGKPVTITVTVVNGENLDISISGDTVFCDGGKSTLTAIEGFTTYIWSNGSTTRSIEVVASGTYTVTGTVAGGCSAIASIRVVESAPIVLDITKREIACDGDENGLISVTVVSGGNAPFLYSLNGGQFGSASTFDNLSIGEYTIMVRDKNGCTGFGAIPIGSKSPITVSLGADQTIEIGEEVQLNGIVAGAQGNIQTTWTPVTNLSCTNCTNPLADPSQTTTYILEVEDENGCKASDTITINVEDPQLPKDIFIPNTFTPNGDLKNDVFVVRGNGIKNISKLAVYNRFGENVYEATNILANDKTTGWNGYYKGKLAPVESYSYVCNVEFIDGTIEELKGMVHIIR
jgi:gliding motility-associated-like protein